MKSISHLDMEVPEHIRKEKMEKLCEGFDWTKKDFNNFCKGMELYGRAHLDRVASCVENKSLHEVKRYAEVFLKLYTVP